MKVTLFVAKQNTQNTVARLLLLVKSRGKSGNAFTKHVVEISTINSHNKCKSIIHGCSLFKLSSVCQFGVCCDGLPTTESIIRDQ